MSKIRYTVEFDMPVSNGIMLDEIYNDLKNTMIRVQDEGVIYWEGNVSNQLLPWKTLNKKLIKDEEN